MVIKCYKKHLFVIKIEGEERIREAVVATFKSYRMSGNNSSVNFNVAQVRTFHQTFLMLNYFLFLSESDQNLQSDKIKINESEIKATLIKLNHFFVTQLIKNI
jgi:hypothetical protein